MLKKILTKKITIFLALVAVLALGVFGFFHYRNAVFSKEILHVEISGPLRADMGQEIEYTLTYKNNGNFVLEQVKLVFELPDNSLTEDSKLRLAEDLPDISPGEGQVLKFKARLLGKEGDVKTTRAWMTYMPHNLSVRYESTAALATTIEKVPITIEFDLPSRIQKNKEITYFVTYVSEVDYPLENVSLKIGVASGFDVASSEPESLDNAEWKLPVLQKGGKGKIAITGTAMAEAGSRLDFSARFGMRIRGVFILLKDAKQEAEVLLPELVISQQITGFAGDAPSASNVLDYQLTFKNTSETSLAIAPAVARLVGLAFDFSTLQSSQGQVKTDHSVAFQLPMLAPEQEAVVNFSVKLKDTITEADTVIQSFVTAGGTSQAFETKVNTGSSIVQ